MSDLLSFAGDHPILAFFLICSVYYLLRFIVIRGYRTINVVCRGWPPAHLDADGDWKPDPKSDA